MTLMMASAQIKQKLVSVTTHSHSQDYAHRDDHTSLVYDMNPWLKPFTKHKIIKTKKDKT